MKTPRTAGRFHWWRGMGCALRTLSASVCCNGLACDKQRSRSATTARETTMRRTILTILLLVVSIPVHAAFVTGTQLKQNLDEARNNSSFNAMTMGMGYVSGVFDMVEFSQV